MKEASGESYDWNGGLELDSVTGRIQYGSKPLVEIPPHFQFFLVRHAETFANQKMIFQGCDVENELTQLTPEGERQASNTADRLVEQLDQSFQSEDTEVIVISSPAQRAFKTAGFFTERVRHLKGRTLKLEIQPFLNEIRFGNMSGLCEEQIRELGAEYQRFLQEFRKRGNAAISLGGSDSFLDVLKRAHSGLKSFLKEKEFEHRQKKRVHLVVFTHMITASALCVALRDETLISYCSESGKEFVNWRRIIQNAECLTWNFSSRRMQTLI